MVTAAVDEGVILANPAEKLGKRMRLTVNTKKRQEEIKAFVATYQSVFETLDAERIAALYTTPCFGLSAEGTTAFPTPADLIWGQGAQFNNRHNSSRTLQPGANVVSVPISGSLLAMREILIHSRGNLNGKTRRRGAHIHDDPLPIRQTGTRPSYSIRTL